MQLLDGQETQSSGIEGRG